MSEARTPDELRAEAARQGRLCKEAFHRKDYAASTRHLARSRELALEALSIELAAIIDETPLSMSMFATKADMEAARNQSEDNQP